MEYVRTGEKLYFGNTGLAALLLFEYFEIGLMILAGIVFGGVLAPLLVASAGLGAALALVTFTAAGLGSTIIAAYLVTEIQE